MQTFDKFSLPIAYRRFVPPALLCALLFVELLAVSLGLDARTLTNAQTGWLASALAASGDVAKGLVLWVAAFVLVVGRRLSAYIQTLAEQRVSLRWLGLHLLAYTLFFYLTLILFRDISVAPRPGTAFAWLIVGMSVAGFWGLAVAPTQYWSQLFQREYPALAMALAVSLVGWWLAQSTSGLWGPLSAATFSVSGFLLELAGADVVLYPEARVLGAGDFSVNIAPVCSGYEGIGLMGIFTGLYLYVFRRDFRFPQALLLFPLGAVAIWFLNAVRIAVLILIGSAWSADVAVGGFHSQAGWITFIVAALALLALAHRSGFFAVAASTPRPLAEVSPQSQLAIATLVPLVVLLAATLLTRAFSAGFDWLYPLRVIATAVAVLWCWRWRDLVPARWRWEPFLVGVGVALLWIVAVPADDASVALHQQALYNAAPGWAGMWMVFRFLGTVLTVPVAEELAFRAYLLCRACGVEVTVRGRLPFSWLGLLLSAVAFGMLHGAWLAGTLAGVAYGFVRLRSDCIGDAIVAHALTNALLFLFVMYSGAWYLL